MYCEIDILLFAFFLVVGLQFQDFLLATFSLFWLTEVDVFSALCDFVLLGSRCDRLVARIRSSSSESVGDNDISPFCRSKALLLEDESESAGSETTAHCCDRLDAVPRFAPVGGIMSSLSESLEHREMTPFSVSTIIVSEIERTQ